jgi:hypothetical protein
MFYSFVVGLLCSVVFKQHLKYSKTMGTLIGLVSYLYNRNASRFS